MLVYKESAAHMAILAKKVLKTPLLCKLKQSYTVNGYVWGFQLIQHTCIPQITNEVLSTIQNYDYEAPHTHHVLLLPFLSLEGR